jgi:myo-inositol 2-dehydrogenase / D-chiro-inositol 1-dehydrogenase
VTKLKIGMISFAHSHAFSYLEQLLQLPNVHVAGIADEDQARVADVVKRNGIPYYDDYLALLATDIDAVIICSENAYHARLAIAAAEHGKHILCEKPLGLNIEEMDQMIDNARTHGVQLMTAFPCRFVPAVVEAKAAIERGDIGEIVAIKGTNRGTKPDIPWFTDKQLAGGGAVFDHTVHVTDLMNWFMPEARVTEVYALAETLFYDMDIDDAGMVHMKYDNGAVAVLDPSWSRTASFPTWGDVTMEITGTKGSLWIDCFEQKNELFSDTTMKANWYYWGDDMDQYMLKAFVAALLNGEPVPVTGLDGKRSTEVALSAYASAASRQPVKL